MSGKSPTIGLYYQSLISLFQMLKDQNWNKVTIEPKDSTKVDIKFELKTPEVIHYYQVKVSSDLIRRSRINSWIKDLKGSISSIEVDKFVLILVGNCNFNLRELNNEIDGVHIPTPINYDLNALKGQISHFIDEFIERKKLTNIRESSKEEIIKIFVSECFESVISDLTLTRNKFENRLIKYIRKFGLDQKKDSPLRKLVYDPLYKQVINEIRRIDYSFFLDDDLFVEKHRSFSKLIFDLERIVEWQRINNELKELCEETRRHFGYLDFLKIKLIKRFEEFLKPDFILGIVPFPDQQISSILQYFGSVPNEEWLERYFGFQRNELRVDIKEFIEIFEEFVMKSDEYLQYTQKKEEIKQNLNSISNKVLNIVK